MAKPLHFVHEPVQRAMSKPQVATQVAKKSTLVMHSSVWWCAPGALSVRTSGGRNKPIVQHKTAHKPSHKIRRRTQLLGSAGATYWLLVREKAGNVSFRVPGLC